MQLRTVLDRNNGLPGNQVHRLAQDRLARFWLAGSSGLYCFDGSRVRAFDRRDGLRCAGLRTVSIGDDGWVWIGTDLGVEAIGAEGRTAAGLQAFDGSFGLVSAILPGSEKVWLGTAQGLVRLDDPHGKPRVGLHLELGYVHDLIRLGDGRLIAACSQRGLLVVDGDECRSMDLPPDLEPSSIRRLASSGELLVVGSIDGVRMLDRDGRALAPGRAVPGGAHVHAVAVQGRQVWVAAGRMLLSYEHLGGGELQHRFSMPAPGAINDLRVDEVGNVWVATDTAGVSQLCALRAALQQVEVPAAVYMVQPQPDGGLAVGGAGFAGSLDMAAAMPAQPWSRMPSTVWDMAPDPGGDGCWLATQGGLYRQRRGAEPVRFEAGGDLLSVPCRAFVLRDGEVWVGTLQGLVRLRGDGAEPVTGNDGLPLGYVYSLQTDARGRLWVATLGRGLWREGPDGLALVSGGPLSAIGNTYVVAPGPSPHRVLVVQDDRVVLLDGDEPPRLLGTEPPVGGWCGLWLDEKYVVIGSNDGLRMVDVGSGEVEQRINSLYGRSFWEFTTSRALARGADGRLYCGLEGGLVVVDLAALAGMRKAPEAKLSGVRWQGAEPIIEDGWTVVAPGKWAFEAQVFAAWWLDHGQVLFRFRLVGFEADWSSPSSQASVRYSSLPPGEYVLQVQAQTSLTGPGGTLMALRLRVPASILAAWRPRAVMLHERLFGMAMRNRRLLKRHEELEVEVAARRAAETELDRHRADLQQEVLARVRELQGARDEAQRANRAKSEFLSRMSHELRTPLNAILGFSQLMAEDHTLTPRHHGYVGETLRAGRHLLTLVNEVLDLARIESGHMVLTIEPLALGPLVDDCLRMVMPAADRHRVALKPAAMPELAVLADSTRLRQVLLNLLSNAVKYNRDGGWVQVWAEPAGAGMVRLNVQDGGIGIAPELHPALFQSFNRLGAELSEIEGTGIGLAIVRQAVELMGGAVGVHSQPGAGSTFWLELPAADLPVTTMPNRDAAAMRQRAVVGQGRLLYVEDDPVNRILMAGLVERHPDLQLLMAETAEQGLKLAGIVRPDLLLLDLNLPDQDGFALLAALRAKPDTAQIPAVAVTAYAMPADLLRTKAAGFVHHLVKPIDIEQFDRVLEQYLPGPTHASARLGSC